MAEAGEQIEVGGPRPDAVQRDERRMRLVGRDVGERVQIDVLFLDRLRDFLQRLHLGVRKADAQQPVLARAENRVVIEWIGDRDKAAVDRGGARGR